MGGVWSIFRGLSDRIQLVFQTVEKAPLNDPVLSVLSAPFSEIMLCTEKKTKTALGRIQIAKVTR